MIVDSFEKGHRVYYHRIVVESDGGEKQVRLVKCGFHPAEAGGKSKRDILASDFVEDEWVARHLWSPI